MGKGQPGAATRWLIDQLDLAGVCAQDWTIRRLSTTGLAPKPRRPHQADRDDPSRLWPPGAVEHYAAAVPLMRQRHDCVELAALTLLGWGYPVAKAAVDHAYAKAFALPDDPDVITDRHAKHPQPFMTQFVRHLRSDDAHRRETSEELVYAIADAATAFFSGKAVTPERARLLMTARFGSVLDEHLAKQAPEIVDFVFRLFARLSEEFSAHRLLRTVHDSTVEELLAAQPAAADKVDRDLKNLGGGDPECSRCAEGRAIWIAYLIPVIVRADDLDWDSVLDSLINQ